MTGIILAGGKASRMDGANKAFLRIGGERLIDRTVRIYRELFAETLVVTNTPLEYLDLDATIVTDIIPGKAALGGIYTGLFFSSCDYAFVSACDMPFLDAPLIRHMMGLAGSHDIVVPRSGEGLQPLHAIYARRLLKPVRRLIDDGRLKVTGLYRKTRVLEVPPETIASFGPEDRLFLNVNSPEDLARIQSNS